MTNRTFGPRGRPDKSTSCSHNKIEKTYGTINTQKGQLSDSNCQGFKSRKISHQNPNV